MVDERNNTIPTSPTLFYFPKSETVSPNDDNGDKVKQVLITDPIGVIGTEFLSKSTKNMVEFLRSVRRGAQQTTTSTGTFISSYERF